jgi:hypothetical protein
MLRVENVATPLEAATDSVPASVPPDGFVPIAMVIELLADVTVFPNESSTVTVTDGVIELPAVTLVGCTENASLFAAPGVTLNVELVAAVKPVAPAVNV